MADSLSAKQTSELLLYLVRQNRMLFEAVSASAEVLGKLIISSVANSSLNLSDDVKHQKIDDAKYAFDSFILKLIMIQEAAQSLSLETETSGMMTSERLEDEG